MWHEENFAQNFRDRINSMDGPKIVGDEQTNDFKKHPSTEWQQLCHEVWDLLMYIFNTPPEDFDIDNTRDKLRDLMDRRVDLKAEEWIWLAEAFIEAENVPRQAVSMLIWQLLFKLYNLLWLI